MKITLSLKYKSKSKTNTSSLLYYYILHLFPYYYYYYQYLYYHMSKNNQIECCSNHSSLKDKWSHNKQSSPMGYQVKSRGITRELDKEPLLHCSSIYINTKWSVLQQCVSLMSIYHASTSCSLLILHVSSLRPPYFLHVPWRHTFNLRCICAHHVYTMRNPCPLMSSLTLALHLDSFWSF